MEISFFTDFAVEVYVWMVVRLLDQLRCILWLIMAVKTSDRVRFE